MNVQETVKKYIVEAMLMGRGGDDLAGDTSFLARDILDSTGVLELAFFLEETFAIKVADEDMVPENLDSLNAIAAFVARKQARVAADRGGVAVSSSGR